MSSTIRGFIWVASFVAILLGIAFLTDTFVLDTPNRPNGHSINMTAGLILLIAGGVTFLYFILVYANKGNKQG